MKKFILFSAAIFLFYVAINAQTNTKIAIPEFKDKYSEVVSKLESGDTTINFRDFRDSFIDSEQFLVASSKFKIFEDFKKDMYAALKKKDYKEVIKNAKSIIEIDYTDMSAHKLLSISYEKLGDTANASKYLNIEKGLVFSIIRSGDAKTCATGWHVIQVSEEYFILNILKAEVKMQSVSSEGGVCDKMETKFNGEDVTYYFDVSKVFEGYNKKFSK